MDPSTTVVLLGLLLSVLAFCVGALSRQQSRHHVRIKRLEAAILRDDEVRGDG